MMNSIKSKSSKSTTNASKPRTTGKTQNEKNAIKADGRQRPYERSVPISRIDLENAEDPPGQQIMDVMKKHPEVDFHGGALDPVILVEVDGVYLIAQGWGRVFLAKKMLGETTIRAQVVPGDRKPARKRTKQKKRIHSPRRSNAANKR